MLAKWHITITDLEGNVIPDATVYVVNEANGGMPSLYADRDGTVDIGNPVSADNTGFCSFHVVGGAYAITARKGGFERTWRYVGIGTAQEYDVGALGNAVGWDEVVDSVTDLPTGVAAGYRVVVLDTDDGRAGVYEWSGTSWLGPIYITGSEGLPGIPNTLTIGTVEEGPEAGASITGQSPNQVLNLVLPLADLTPELQQLREDAVQAAADAADSESAAAGSATNAQGSADAAAASAGNAATSEANASASAASAATSESNAASSESAAENAATVATEQAGLAVGASTSASGSAAAAFSSEQNAAQSETNAAQSETNAASSETAAAESEANALLSEQNAATSESNAADSAADALASELSAAADALIAAAAVREGYGIKLYYSEGVPAGGWFADRYVAADSMQSLLYAEIVDGYEGAELGVTMLVNGQAVYGPVWAEYGTPLVLDGLEISVGEGDAVDFVLTPTPDAVRRVIVKTQGRLV